MKIHILSDLHLEFGPLVDYTTPECDVIILAGDISVAFAGVKWANKLSEATKKPVVYVTGNHEYYGFDKIDWLDAGIKLIAGPNVHVLQNDTVVINGVTFIGTTLWTDFALYNNPHLAAQVARSSMNDYRRIEREPHGSLRPEDTMAIHNVARSFLESSLEQHKNAVVVTHHAPSEQSVHKKYRGDPVTPAFASNLEPLILKAQPKLWVHGHMHDSCDYCIDKTRVVCNPRGYRRGYRNENTNFNPGLIVDITV